VTFAAPIWLLGLLPWAAVVAYLLWGRRRRVEVPFLDLWPAPGDDAVRVRRRVMPPPVALALAILATLLAVLAAGRPQVMTSFGGSTISVVLDRGYTMSARGAGASNTRLVELIDSVGRAIPLLRPMRRWVVPGDGPSRTDASDLINPPAQTPTASDTRVAMRLAVRAALSGGAEPAGPVIILSDQATGIDDARLLQIAPPRAVRNARIVSFAARETPAAQVMVRVRGSAGIERATVRVSSGDRTSEGMVALSPDRETDAFIDLSVIGQTIKAELLVEDDQPADDTAWLVREASWPRLEPRAPMSLHVQRMIDVFARQRPPGESSGRVVLVRSAEGLPADAPAAVVVAPVQLRDNAAGGVVGTLEAVDHPINRGVNWADAGMPDTAPGGPPAGWTPVVSAGGKVWVAVRNEPIRAVWVGFDSGPWSRSSAFVVFWANVFNWAGAGGERFASYPVGSLEGDWQAVELAGSATPPQPMLWPGLYRRASDGVVRALHAPDVPIALDVPSQTDWRERLSRLIAEAGGRTELTPGLALAALVCLALAAWTWKRRAARP
jgi:hypothetical protein